MDRIEKCYLCGEIIYRIEYNCHIYYYSLDEIDHHCNRWEEIEEEKDKKPGQNNEDI